MPSYTLASPLHGPGGQHQGRWRPLLEGTLQERALEAVKAIAASLRERTRSAVGGAEPATAEAALTPSLAGGPLGPALLFAYLSESLAVPTDRPQAANLLGRAIHAAEQAPAEAALYSGLTGVGWAAAHLCNRLPLPDGADINDEIDETLADHVSRSPWTEDYDLIGGLVGFGVYALERLPRPMAVSCLECVIDRLAETAERRPEGVSWWTNPAWLPPETRAECPRGYYNTGLAHGVPGVIALLGQACAVGIATERARPLLDGAIPWLLAQQRPGGFPAWVAPDVSPAPTRLAWCYGDPGVAVALLWAARCVGKPNWEREALAIARRAVERPAEQSGVVDAGLCHGAAGLGHLFNRLYQATGEARFANAARFWFERTLAMRQPDRGVAGYAAWMPGIAGNKEGWGDDPGLLTGAAGIALALLAAATPVEPAWDRILLVSVPPAS